MVATLTLLLIQPLSAEPESSPPTYTPNEVREIKKHPEMHPTWIPPPDWVCNHQGLFHAGIPQTELCDIATIYCSGNFINFYRQFYCRAGASMPQLIIGGSLLIFIIFRYTGIVVDDYIAPGIEWLNTKFGFSEALGGVTLLAFANGAGDVITALVAGGSAGGVSYNVGS